MHHTGYTSCGFQSKLQVQSLLARAVTVDKEVGKSSNMLHTLNVGHNHTKTTMRDYFRLTILIFICILLQTCSIDKNISGRTFVSKTKGRIAQLRFDNDSICHFINTFQCNDIDPKYKEIIISCRYVKRDSIIILRNDKCKSDTCRLGLTIDIPPQESKKCYFLNEKSREVHFSIGPTYMTAYEKYGFIPNIDIDTIYIIKSKLILIKGDSMKTIGLIFK